MIVSVLWVLLSAPAAAQAPPMPEAASLPPVSPPTLAHRFRNQRRIQNTGFKLFAWGFFPGVVGTLMAGQGCHESASDHGDAADAAQCGAGVALMLPAMAGPPLVFLGTHGEDRVLAAAGLGRKAPWLDVVMWSSALAVFGVSELFFDEPQLRPAQFTAETAAGGLAIVGTGSAVLLWVRGRKQGRAQGWTR